MAAVGLLMSGGFQFSPAGNNVTEMVASLAVYVRRAAHRRGLGGGRTSTTALMRLFEGRNIGKQLVKVADA